MSEELKKLLAKLAEMQELSQAENDTLTKLLAQLEEKKIPIQDVIEDKKTVEVPVRKIDFSDNVPPSKVRSIGMISRLPARLLNDTEKDIQEHVDNAYVTSVLLGCNPRSLKMWQSLEESRSALKKAMDTATAGEGQEWVPTGLSAEVIEKFRLESKVAKQFRDIPMPSNPYDLPYTSGGITFYYVPESTSDEPSKSPASQAGTGKRTLTAKKLKTRVLFSDELAEDSIVPILPTLKEDIYLAGAESLDDVIINGDTTSPHMDSDVTNSKDHRKAWNGLRDLCPAGTKADLGTFNTTNLRARRKAMGKYGVMPSELIWIASPTSYYNLLGLTEVITVDKYGAQATVISGELAKFDGAPIIVSEKVRETLNASGVYDGITMTKTLIILVNKRGFILGSRGQAKLSFKTDDDVDQNTLYLRFRKAFVDRWDVTGNNTIALGYNIA